MDGLFLWNQDVMFSVVEMISGGANVPMALIQHITVTREPHHSAALNTYLPINFKAHTLYDE